MSRVREIRCRSVGSTGDRGEWRETVAVSFPELGMGFGGAEGEVRIYS